MCAPEALPATALTLLPAAPHAAPTRLVLLHCPRGTRRYLLDNFASVAEAVAWLEREPPNILLTNATDQAGLGRRWCFVFLPACTTRIGGIEAKPGRSSPPASHPPYSPTISWTPSTGKRLQAPPPAPAPAQRGLRGAACRRGAAPGGWTPSAAHELAAPGPLPTHRTGACRTPQGTLPSWSGWAAPCASGAAGSTRCAGAGLHGLACRTWQAASRQSRRAAAPASIPACALPLSSTVPFSPAPTAPIQLPGPGQHARLRRPPGLHVVLEGRP